MNKQRCPVCGVEIDIDDQKAVAAHIWLLMMRPIKNTWQKPGLLWQKPGLLCF